eukprot:6182769-Pleurochrysis_carterae.AAC.2
MNARKSSLPSTALVGLTACTMPEACETKVPTAAKSLQAAPSCVRKGRRGRAAGAARGKFRRRGRLRRATERQNGSACKIYVRE